MGITTAVSSLSLCAPQLCARSPPGALRRGHQGREPQPGDGGSWAGRWRAPGAGGAGPPAILTKAPGGRLRTWSRGAMCEVEVNETSRDEV